ncbi:actin-interacting protein 1-like isoform X2 [Hyalella azteca]|uniref:Actin-interacting protein 1 n=1 Tax=Hyalella azteca TaxID=294128 RepID=A0A8B7PKN3_HYAAZ|nr:actin-interacting protein 1-like isoform X2 [Hyalella azteca]
MSYANESIWACLPRTVRGQPVVLGCDPKGEKLLYGHGNSVIIRDIKNPSVSEIYTEHSVPVTVAKWAPSGYYICSADIHGKVRIWDTVNAEHVLKAEYQPLGGCIRDLVWSPDSQRIAVVGDGRGKFAHVFMMDTGASVKGDLSGHSKVINSVDWKTSRPFRLVTGAEDNKVALYDGPPFQFMCSKTEHQKYVQVVRFSPNGEHFASGGFDGKVFVYDGKSGEVVREVGEPGAHKGGIYGLSWSPDNTRILTASGDKTCKIWKVETGELLAEYNMGSQVEDQQMSCIWTPANHLLSLSLSGFINYLNPDQPGAPEKIVKGHSSPITRVSISPDGRQLYTSAMDGCVTRWDVATGDSERVEGKGHGNQVTGLVVMGAGADGGAGKVFTIGIDDTLQVIDPCQMSYTTTRVSLSSQPRFMCSWPRPGQDAGLAVVTVKDITLLTDQPSVVSTTPTSYEGQCVAVSGDGALLAAGGSDNKLRVYSISGSTLTETQVLEHLGVVTGVVFSSCGKYLAACDAYRKVKVYNTSDWTPAIKAEWGFHNAKINCIAFSPNSELIATGSLDTTVIVWSMKDMHKRITLQKCHPQSQVTDVLWLSDEYLVTVAHDATVKTWTIKF